MFVELSLNMGIKWRNLATSSVLHSVHMIPADLHPDKTMLFAFWSVSIIWVDDKKIKIAEINAPLN